MNRPLEGMRVLDLSVWRPMPHATQILSDLGADVLKIEPPGGDPMRAFPAIFASIARGKRSVVLDLKSQHGAERVRELVADAHVVCSAWRPGVAERLGVGSDALRAARPDLICCSISGYGHDGPLRDVPGHDLNFQAVGGALRRIGDDAAVPPTPRLPVADLEAGTVAALAICAAWARRLVTGEGDTIDVAMADVIAWWAGTSSATGFGNGTTGAWPGYGVFRTADDQFVSLAPLTEDSLWHAICTGLGLDSLAAVPIDERVARTTELNDEIASAIAALPRDDALARLLGAGAPVAPVLAPEETVTHPHFVARRLHAPAGDAVVVPLPIADPDVRPTHVPSVGEHVGFASSA